MSAADLPARLRAAAVDRSEVRALLVEAADALEEARRIDHTAPFKVPATDEGSES